MISFLVALLLTCLTFRIMIVNQRKKEQEAERQFRLLMRSLEDKAKREGTFNGSYFGEIRETE